MSLDAIRDLVQHDPGNRGLARDPLDNLLTRTRGDLASACRCLADANGPVGIVTGFWIPTAEPPSAETDGPLGALFLARALRTLGIPVVLVIDPFGMPALQAGVAATGLSGQVDVCSVGEVRPLSCFIALERVGPNYTIETLGQRPWATQETLERFRTEVAPEKQGRCYTMKGRDITAFMQPAHEWFEAASRPCPTIGIGDGGNEIGMGKLPWEVLVRNIPNGGLIACRVPTDHLIVAGVSNWGAYALAAGLSHVCGRQLPPELFDPERERQLLQVMVERGPLVDGVTGKPTATVDGLSWDDYVRPLIEIGRLMRR